MLSVIVFSLIRIVAVYFSAKFVPESKTLSEAVHEVGALRAAPYNKVHLLGAQRITFVVVRAAPSLFSSSLSHTDRLACAVLDVPALAVLNLSAFHAPALFPTPRKYGAVVCP
jgi:hypothetical protein